jgi:hypothetical protein
MRKAVMVVLVAVVVATGVLAGSYFLLNVSEQGGAPRPAVIGKLILSNPPALNQTAVLTYSIENVRLWLVKNPFPIRSRHTAGRYPRCHR